MKKPSIYKILALYILLFNNLILGDLYKPKKVLANEASNNVSSDYIRQIPDASLYILGSGDTISLKVSEDTKELNKVFTIDGQGIINLKRLRRIYVAGLTIEELTKILNNEYAKYVKEPDVELLILKYRPIKFFIDGEVESPGFHVIEVTNSLEEDSIGFKARNSLISSDDSLGTTESLSDKFLGNNIYFPSIIDAIRKSKGVTMYADMKNIKITRVNSITNGRGLIGTTVNLIDALDLKDSSQNLRIFDGDTIFIPRNDKPLLSEISKAIKSNMNPKFVDVYIGGRVESPGPVTVSKSSVLNEALNLSGGTKFLKGKVNFLRYNYDGTIDKRNFALNKSAPRGSYKNPFLKDGDFIYVGKSALNISTEILTDLTAPLQSIFSSYGLFKLVVD